MKRHYCISGLWADRHETRQNSAVGDGSGSGVV
jgi:hypothetical protein